MNNKLLIGFLVLIAGIGIGWYVLGYQKPKEEKMKGSEETSKQMPVPGTSGVSETVVSTIPATGAGAMEKGEAMAKVVVKYTDAGFTPAMVTVKKGTTVTFTNESSGGMWVASNPHPTHTLLPGFDELKAVAKGQTYVYTFEKVGTWKYHNHMKVTDTGTVIVTE